MKPDSAAAPFACALPPEELRARRAALMDELAPAVLEVETVAGGYRFWLEATPARLAQLAELIAFERECCAFLDFALEVRSGSTRLSLTLTGPPAAQAAIEALFAAPVKGASQSAPRERPAGGGTET